jgi:sec-independent protein translocase protein TatB
MFNIGPLELMVLAIVGLIVLGPDRLPGLAKDAARMIRTLRELATGARTQLRDELGPEFADVDLRNLNPRTALSRAILGDDEEAFRSFNPREAMQRTIFGDDDDAKPVTVAGEPPAPPAVDLQKPASTPLRRDEQAPFDADAT